MEELNIPTKLIRMVKLLMSNTYNQVKIQNLTSKPFQIHNGVRQGDALACLLFNIALESVVRKSEVQTRSNIFYKSTQILAFADDIVIIGRSVKYVKEVFLSLEQAGKEIGLIINERKTKYMLADNGKIGDKIDSLQISDYNFEKVDNFTYLGSVVTSDNNMSKEISNRLMKANRAYFSLKYHFSSHALSRKVKFILYKTLVRPVLTYAAEPWSISKNDEKRLEIFERKILRRIYGPTFEEGLWRRRCNYELYRLLGEPNIINTVKTSRLRWAGQNDAETDQKEKKELAEKKLPTEECIGKNGEQEKCLGQKKISVTDDIKICGSYVETKRKAENRNDSRMLGLQRKNCPWAERNVESFEQFGSPEERHQGKPRVTTAGQDRFLYLKALKERTSTATMLRSALQNHDGAPEHSSRQVTHHLNITFIGRWIGKYGHVSWPPRSPDLTPLDFCLWGWLKGEVYKEKVNTRANLIVQIMNNAALIKECQDDLRRATRGVVKRSRKCIEVGGGIYENQF
ncbi:hypothetical protein ANN_22334 [Periplaneta americana]|uniref:Reverse transcriptase domain-containing protein n=1 Tax=Periplaneta americana TaxID=6978 RepID=A0ABQ8S7V3_PERAM|nr:hypothetical protein ANN_22334 [Periplaneta americana]